MFNSLDQHSHFSTYADHDELEKDVRNNEHGMKTSAKKVGKRVVFKWSKKLSEQCLY